MSRYVKLREYTESEALADFFEEAFPSLADTLFMYYKEKDYHEFYKNIEDKHFKNQDNDLINSLKSTLNILDLSEETIEKFNIIYEDGFYYLAEFKRIKSRFKDKLIARLFVAIGLIADFSKKFEINSQARCVGRNSEGLILLPNWKDLFGELWGADSQVDDDASPIFAIFKQLYLGVIPADYSSSYLNELGAHIRDSYAKKFPRINLLTLLTVHKVDYFIVLYIIYFTGFLSNCAKHFLEKEYKLIISKRWRRGFIPYNPKIENEEEFCDYLQISVCQHGWTITFSNLPHEDMEFAIKVSSRKNVHSYDCSIINVFYKILSPDIAVCYAQTDSEEKIFAIQKNQYNLSSKIKTHYHNKKNWYILENILSWNNYTLALNSDLWFNFDEETKSDFHSTIATLLNHISNNEIEINLLKNCFLHVRDNNIQFDNEEYSNSLKNYNLRANNNEMMLDHKINQSSQDCFMSWYESINKLRKKLKLSNRSDSNMDAKEDNFAHEPISEEEFYKKWNLFINESNDREKVRLFCEIQKWQFFENATNKDVSNNIKEKFPDEYISLTINTRNNKEVGQHTLEKNISNLVTESRNFAIDNDLPHKPQKVGKRKVSVTGTEK